MINPPINPPTHPDDDSDRIFLYRISDDRTHYEFIGECESVEEMATAMVQPVGFESESIAAYVQFHWYPGDKCTVDGLPYPHDPENPPYAGFSIARDEDGNEFTEECDR